MSVKYNFEGKVALVTGSSSGIGAAAALLFAKSGASVVVTGRNAANVSSVAKECREVSNESNVLEVVADLTNEDDIKRLIDSTIKTFAKLDILVNNAGFGLVSPVTDPNYYQNFKKVMETNLNSVVLLTQLSIPHLEKTKGNVINISSIAGIRSSGKLFSPYYVSKAAMDMFTKCMAAELGIKGIRVNVVNPGAVKTNFGAGMGVDQKLVDELTDKMVKKLPMARIGQGIDIAHTILFLASDDSSFITGSSLVSDGGDLAANVN